MIQAEVKRNFAFEILLYFTFFNLVNLVSCTVLFYEYGEISDWTS